MNEQRVRELVELLRLEVNAPSLPVAPVPVVSSLLEPRFTDYGKFFDWLRDDNMLGPKISKTEFEGCGAIILACQKEDFAISWTAYALATAYLETAHSMQPIKEFGGTAYYTRMYDITGQRPAKARELGNLSAGDGAKYPGMGYVQLTGKKNYQKATDKLRALGLNVDLVANPSLAMRPDVAALVMAVGMLEGWFTARKITDDLPSVGPASLRQFVMTRDVINGTDKDDEIAAFAMKFQSALSVGGYQQ